MTPAAESQVSIVDISVLREATERIVSLQSELEAMLAAFPDPCVWVDEHGRIVSAKGGVAVNQSLREAMPPEASAALHRALSTAMKSRAPVTTEYHVGAADGPRRTYEAPVVPLAAAARSPKLFIVIRDVTEHRARETDYREMVDGSANGLCIHRHYVLQFANRTMARMFGYDRPADLVGVDIRTLIPGHRAPTPAANSGAARPGTRRQQVEGVKRDGQRVAEAGESRSLRIWSAGCSSGEEPYSIAMLIAEHLGDPAADFNVRIYATDVDEEALQAGRHGLYRAEDLKDVPTPLLEKYFAREGQTFRFRRDIRRWCIFGKHNIVQDPPLSHIDMVVCRNVLIYFTSDLQERIPARRSTRPCRVTRSRRTTSTPCCSSRTSAPRSPGSPPATRSRRTRCARRAPGAPDRRLLDRPTLRRGSGHFAGIPVAESGVSHGGKDTTMMLILLWLLGVPLALIIILWLIGVGH